MKSLTLVFMASLLLTACGSLGTKKSPFQSQSPAERALERQNNLAND